MPLLCPGPPWMTTSAEAREEDGDEGAEEEGSWPPTQGPWLGPHTSMDHGRVAVAASQWTVLPGWTRDAFSKGLEQRPRGRVQLQVNAPGSVAASTVGAGAAEEEAAAAAAAAAEEEEEDDDEPLLRLSPKKSPKK